MTDFDRQVIAVYGQLGRQHALSGLSLEEGREAALDRARSYRHQRNLLDEIAAEHERGYRAVTL